MHKYPKTSANFDLLFVVLSFWLTIGVFIDGWAHNHLLSALETFFTPWHAIFYSGFTAVSLLLIFEAIRNFEKGFRWPRLLPREYHLSFLGLAIFLLSGIGDLLWHTVFGIEADVEALLSPTHLLLALGGALITCAPFHALWHRDIKEKPPALAIILSLTLFFSLLTFMTQFAHPIHHPWMDVNFATNPSDSGQAIGVASILVQTGILMGIVLTVLRKWEFPFASFAVLVGLNAALMSILQDQYRFILASIISGFVVDIFYKIIRPKTSRPRAIRLFATLAPITIYSAYTATIFLTSGTSWSIHLWAGAIVMTGITGFLLSYLVVEPVRGESYE